MTRSTGRLVATPDDSSDANEGVSGSQDKRNGPAVVLVLVTPGAGPGRHHDSSDEVEVPAMAKRTRGPDPVDSETRDSAVKITPASTVSATVPTTHAVA